MSSNWVKNSWFWAIFGQRFHWFSLIFNEFIMTFQWFSLNFNQGVVQELVKNSWFWAQYAYARKILLRKLFRNFVKNIFTGWGTHDFNFQSEFSIKLFRNLWKCRENSILSHFGDYLALIWFQFDFNLKMGNNWVMNWFWAIFGWRIQFEA